MRSHSVRSLAILTSAALAPILIAVVPAGAPASADPAGGDGTAVAASARRPSSRATR